MSNYDDSIFRRDWEGRYASSGGRYEDYEPAYRYGSYLAGSERWRGRQWSEIEPDVRSEWEASHPRGTWERFKDSIRYGWESMTGSRDSSTRQMGSSGGYDDSARQMGSPGRGAGSTGMGRPTTEYAPTMRGGPHNADETDFRRQGHHSYWTSGGSTNDYAPAYRYGADFADNDTNPNHQWADVEAYMRSEWEAYNKLEENSWEKNKDAIRHGWEKGKQYGRDTRSGHALR